MAFLIEQALIGQFGAGLRSDPARVPGSVDAIEDRLVDGPPLLAR